MKIKSQLVPRDWNPHKAIYDIKAIPETWTIQKLLEEYFTTYIDYAFQRPYTWTENDVMEFITSIIRNNLRSKITIASPQDCANFVKGEVGSSFTPHCLTHLLIVSHEFEP